MHPAYFPVFFWSLFIFASFLGYGETLRRALKRSEFEGLGWGLTAAWGMAVTLAIGGFLMVFKLAIAPILIAVIVLGAALAVLHGVTHLMVGRFSLSSFRLSLADLVLYLLAALAFASSIAWPNHVDPNDDLICYLMLPEKLLCTGTLIEPFSFQRAGTYGGQAILQALVMIVGAERNGHVPDRGIAMVMMFGMLVHATRGLRGQQAIVRFLLLFAFWFVPVPRISTHGAIDGGCLLIAMLITRELLLKANSKNLLGYIPVGLLLAGACCIRPTFTVVAGTILSALLIKDMLSAIKSKSSALRTLMPYSVVVGSAIVFLLPFMLVLYESNGTPMIPPFSGYVSKAYQTYAFNDFWKDMGAVIAFYTTPDQYRFIYPILVPIALWLLSELLQNTAQQKPAKSTKSTPLTERVLLPVGAASISLLAFILVNAGQGSRELREQFVGLPKQVEEVKPFFDPNLKKAYESLQNLVPPGEKILTMADASYWFDFKRNEVYSINAVGSSSPPPGLPFDQGPQAFAKYLKSLGIRYVIAVDFDNAVLLYTRKLWTETTRPEWIYSQIWRPRFLDVMANFDALDKEGAVVARAGNLRLFDLGH
ncbi:MAG: hypothetical protein NTU84_04180 [Verrucomicrobia bacterium]|nr:hypothetical protein [Verrucomicrobiota bacterium]